MKSTQNDLTNNKGTKKEYKKTKQFLKKQERTKKDIIDAARYFFSVESFDNVVLKDIAKKALVSRTTLFNYFKNKEDILFAVSNQVNMEENELLVSIVNSDLTGKEQILTLCKKTFKDRAEKPIVSKILKEFWYRLNSKNFTAGEVYAEIVDKIGADQLDRLIQDPILLKEYDFEKHFTDQKYFIQLFIQLLRTGNLWVQAIQKGKKDGTIKNNLADLQIVQYINVFMVGLVDEMQLRQSALDRINMKSETFEINTLNLISVFLESNIKG